MSLPRKIRLGDLLVEKKVISAHQLDLALAEQKKSGRKLGQVLVETGCLTQGVKDDIVDCCKTVVGLEDKFIDLAFDMGAVNGMTPKDIQNYIRYVADWRLSQLGLPAVYNIKEHPLPWLQQILNGVEHANFFEARSTEYSKAATRGQWHGVEGVWSHFDKMMDTRKSPVAAE